MILKLHLRVRNLKQRKCCTTKISYWNSSAKILKKLDTIPVVGSLLGDIPLLCMIVVDYVKGEYTEIPLASVIGIIAALIYFSVRLIDPDCIPGLGCWTMRSYWNCD